MTGPDIVVYALGVSTVIVLCANFSLDNWQTGVWTDNTTAVFAFALWWPVSVPVWLVVRAYIWLTELPIHRSSQ